MRPATIGDLVEVFGNVVKIALTGAGIASLVMLVVGGFKYLSAGGDKEATQKASRTITYAIGGLIVVLSSWIILSLLGGFLGLNFQDFSVCLPGFTDSNCHRII
jgi:hypothetical protein